MHILGIIGDPQPLLRICVCSLETLAKGMAPHCKSLRSFLKLKTKGANSKAFKRPSATVAALRSGTAQDCTRQESGEEAENLGTTKWQLRLH